MVVSDIKCKRSFYSNKVKAIFPNFTCQLSQRQGSYFYKSIDFIPTDEVKVAQCNVLNVLNHVLKYSYVSTKGTFYLLIADFFAT